MRIRDGPAAVRETLPRHEATGAGRERRRGREPRVRRPAALPWPNPSRKEDSGAISALVALAAADFAVVVAGASGGTTSHQTGSQASFPVTIVASNGKVTVARKPRHRLALADGDGVVVRHRSRRGSRSTTSPTIRRACRRRRCRLTPNVEAIASYRPDLVVIAYDPKGLSDALARLGITVVHQDGAKSFKGAYQQIRQLGLVTGHESEARGSSVA